MYSLQENNMSTNHPVLLLLQQHAPSQRWGTSQQLFAPNKSQIIPKN
jgi:hypothetical protein